MLRKKERERQQKGHTLELNTPSPHVNLITCYSHMIRNLVVCILSLFG